MSIDTPTRPAGSVRQLRGGKWQARVGHEQRSLGVFDTEAEALEALNSAPNGPSDPAAAPLAPTPALVTIPLECIEPDPDQPRKFFDEEALAELAGSITEDGVLEPILVRPLEDGRFRIVAGERRWRASKLAGQAAIPAIVRADVDAEKALRMAIIENVQRRDLSALEEAAAYRRLHELGMRQAAIAAAVHRSQPVVAKTMGLLDLPEEVQDLIRDGQLTPSHGHALHSWAAFPELVTHLARLAATDDLPSAALEGDVLRQYGYHLENRGLVDTIPQHLPFAKTCAEACPFNAYRPTNEWSPGVCLRPEHKRELMEELEAKEQARFAAEAAKYRAAANGVLPLATSLGYNIETLLSTPPEGCTGECPCRVKALDHYGKQVEVCTDPKRLQKLRRAVENDFRKRRAAEHRSAQLKVEKAIDELEEGDPYGERELALLACMALRALNRPKAVDEALEHCGYDRLLEHAGTSRFVWSGRFQELARALRPRELIRLVLEAILREDLAEHFEGYVCGADKTAWYLRDREIPHSNALSPDVFAPPLISQLAETAE